jgi:hypothetical protein
MPHTFLALAYLVPGQMNKICATYIESFADTNSWCYSTDGMAKRFN